MPVTPRAPRWSGAGHEIPAFVPGRLLDAALEAGIAVDPSAGLSSRANEWLALREWTLTGTLNLQGNEAERLFLTVRGAVGAGRVFVGREAVSAFHAGDNEIEITAQTADRGQTAVSLAFDAALPEGSPPSARAGVEGWSVRGVNQMRIADWRVVPRIVDGYGVIESTIRAVAYVPGRYAFRVVASLGGETLGADEIVEKLPAGEATVTHRLVLPVPKPYAPGEPNEPIVARLTATRSGLVCDDLLRPTGFLDASFAASPPLQLSVRGERLFLKGAEWRADGLLTDTETARRLDLLRDAHVNCLRVYGLPSEALLDALCARGFLLWQVLPHDAETAAQAVRRVRHRPALIAYGMERLDVAFNRPADDWHPTVRAVRAVVEEGDGRRPFFGPIPGGQVSEPGRGDLGTGRLRDVFGPARYPGPEALCADMNLDDAQIRTVAAPAPKASGDGLRDAALFAHYGAPPLDLAALAEWFDAPKEDPACLARLLRMAQAETIRYAAERARMRGAKASGVFVVDPFAGADAPNGAALVDAQGPRPGYFALESALRPLHACARLDRHGAYCGTAFEARLGLLCDAPTLGPVTVRGRLYLPDGAVLAEASFSAQPETAELGALCATLPDYPCALVLRVTAERYLEQVDVNDYVIGVGLHAPLWAIAHAPYATIRKQDGYLINDCAQAAYGVAFGGYAEARLPGWGALLPGEGRQTAREAPVEAINAEPAADGL